MTEKTKVADVPFPLKYRPDIDGMRAVAVAAVILFHARPEICPGGFIGVDIFFVLSGFLITRIILADLYRGEFSFAGFYSRRIRRIFPALLMVLAFSLAAGWYLLTPGEWYGLTRNVVGGAGFFSNLMQSRYMGYFNPTVRMEPLLHLWSLGNEEQFYIVWPLALAILWKRGNLLPVILLIAGLSFALDLELMRDGPSPAFFNPLGRTWELLAGAALARFTLLDGEVKGGEVKGRARAETMSAAGVALIAAGLALLNESRTFPGWWALLPVVGAVLLVGAGPEAWFNRRVLASRPLVAIGLISYPLYLWHWPLLVYLRIAWPGQVEPPEIASAAVVALTVVLSWATYRFWERPMRFSKKWPSQFRVRLLVAGMASVAVLAAFGPGILPPRLNSPVARELDRARIDRLERWWNYEIRSRSAEATLLVGDSHMIQYEERAAAAIQENPSLATAVFATFGGCPPLPGINSTWPGSQCLAFYDYWTGMARGARFSTVAISAYWESYALSARFPRTYHGHQATAADYEEAWGGLARELQTLVRAGKRVVIFASNPVSAEFDPGFGFDRLHPAERFRPAALPRATVEKKLEPVTRKLQEIARFSGAEMISPLDYLCRGGECPALDTDGLPIYMDKDHIRASKAAKLATFVDDVLRPRRRN